MSRIKRQCQFNGNWYEMEIPGVDQITVNTWLDLRRTGHASMVQEVWPELTPEQREFLLTGTPPEVWNQIFPPEEEEE